MKWPSSAEDAETGKLQVVGRLHFALHRARARNAPSAQVNHPADDGIVVQSFLRVAQHIISAVDALHLYGAFLPRQVRMVAPRQLAIGPFDGIAIRVYGYAQCGVIIVGCVHIYIYTLRAIMSVAL